MESSPSVIDPPGLGTRGLRLWREVTDANEFRPDELVLLEEGCRLLDELAVMSARIVEDGPVTEGSRKQPRAHPLLSEVRAHRSTVARIFRQLGIPDPDDGELAPPVALSERKRRAAESRWRRRGSA